MDCIKCGNNAGAGSRLCLSCANKSLENRDNLEESRHLEPASLLVRFAALFIDGILVSIVGLLITFVALVLNLEFSGKMSYWQQLTTLLPIQSEEFYNQVTLQATIIWHVFMIFYIAITFHLFGGTLGKAIAGLLVVDVYDYQPSGALQGIFRDYIGKIGIYMIAGIFIVFLPPHPLILFPYLFLIFVLSIFHLISPFLNSERRAFHDFIGKTQVVHKR